jgi:hypothetical protein
MVLIESHDMEEMRNTYNILADESEGKRPLGRPRRRQEDINMRLKEVGYEIVGWHRMNQDRDRWRALVSTVVNLWFP